MPEDQDLTIASDSDSLKALSGLPARFENRGIIGQGGMGMVFKALDLELNREVAIKLLLFDGASDEVGRQRFMREAQALTKLEHLNIVRLLQVGTNSSGNPYQVLELLSGSPLSFEIGAGKRLSAERFFEIFSQVLDGLQHAHEQGIIHRDIKPSNIMLCKIDGELCPKIIDFGIARFDNTVQAAKTLTETNFIIGSPTYMSPEQCKGNRVDHRCDIYSLACVMYEAIKGETPFQSENSIDLIYKHLNAAAPDLEKQASSPAAKRLGRLIARSLSKDPENRPQSAAEMAEELSEIFKNKLNNDRLFVKAKITNKKNLLLSITAIALAAIAVSAFLLRRQQVRENASDSIIQSKAELKQRAQEKDLIRLNKAIKTLRRSKNENELFGKLLELGKTQSALGFQKDSQASFAEAYAIALKLDKISRKEDHIAMYFNNLSKSEEAKVPLDEVKLIELLDQGLAAKSRSLYAVPNLSFRRCQIHFKYHEFGKAIPLLRRLMESAWVPHTNMERRMMNDAVMPPSQGIDYASRLSEMLVTLDPNGLQEKQDMLKVMNLLLKYLIENKALQSGRPLVGKITSLIESEQLKPDQDLIRESQQLLLRYAEDSEDQGMKKKYQQILKT